MLIQIFHRFIATVCSRSRTLMLFPGMSGSPLREVKPGEEGKLRRGGGGGGDLEGFSVRYRGTVSSSVGREGGEKKKEKSEACRGEASRLTNVLTVISQLCLESEICFNWRLNASLFLIFCFFSIMHVVNPDFIFYFRSGKI